MASKRSDLEWSFIKSLRRAHQVVNEVRQCQQTNNRPRSRLCETIPEIAITSQPSSSSSSSSSLLSPSSNLNQRESTTTRTQVPFTLRRRDNSPFVLGDDGLRDGGLQNEDAVPLPEQPGTRPVSQEQLAAEVKGIYASLATVESKCIGVDKAQSLQGVAKLNNEQWQSLIRLHRRLLHEQHDSSLIPQLLSTGRGLRELASRYASPARMWCRGLQPFLELLRHHLPASLGRLFTYVDLPHSLMKLWSEIMPSFEDSWMDLLSDLGIYRMGLGDDEIRDREVWTSVSRHWYSQMPTMAMTTGRDHQRLATLSQTTALQQLFQHTGSIRVSTLFTSARCSIMTLFDPILSTRFSSPRFAEETGSLLQNNGRASSPSLSASSLLGALMLSNGASASPTDNKPPNADDESQILVAPNIQWPWHLVIWLSCFAWAGLSWAIERRNDASTQNYEAWFLIAAFVCYLAYGYKAFVERRLDSATR